jgi:hypothetical protein
VTLPRDPTVSVTVVGWNDPGTPFFRFREVPHGRTSQDCESYQQQTGLQARTGSPSTGNSVFDHVCATGTTSIVLPYKYTASCHRERTELSYPLQRLLFDLVVIFSEMSNSIHLTEPFRTQQVFVSVLYCIVFAGAGYR